MLNYDSDATQLGSDEDSATQYESEEWRVCLIDLQYKYGEREIRLFLSFIAPRTKPQLAPAHEWSDDCVSDKQDRRRGGELGGRPRLRLSEGKLSRQQYCRVLSLSAVILHVCALGQSPDYFRTLAKYFVLCSVCGAGLSTR